MSSYFRSPSRPEALSRRRVGEKVTSIRASRYSVTGSGGVEFGH
ncbi:MAG: hypothetical protein ACOYLR_12130 [Chlorobium sp.]